MFAGHPNIVWMVFSFPAELRKITSELGAIGIARRIHAVFVFCPAEKGKSETTVTTNFWNKLG